MASSLLYDSSVSSRVSPNTEQKYLLNVAGVCASSLVLGQLQRLQDLSPCQDFFWPHDATAIPPSAASPSWQEAPFITFPLIYVLPVATSPLHPFPFIVLQQDGLWLNHLPEQGHPVKFNPARLCSGMQGKDPPGDASPHSTCWAGEAALSSE